MIIIQIMSANVDYSLALTGLDIDDLNDEIFNDVRTLEFIRVVYFFKSIGSYDMDFLCEWRN